MALSDTALISVATARAWLSGLPSVDADVERLIESASQIANSYAQRHLAATGYTERLSGSGSSILLLKQHPIQSITSVHIDGSWEFGTDTVCTDYESDTSAGILYLYSGWPVGERNIKVVYRAGYELASVPKEIQQAVVEVMAWTQRRITGGQVGMSTHSFGDESVSYEMTPPVSAQRIFESYRDARIG